MGGRSGRAAKGGAVLRDNQYIASAYFAIATLTTVGYGDITAQTAPEMGVAAAIMIRPQREGRVNVDPEHDSECGLCACA